MNRTSTFPQSIDQESHWDGNSTAGTDVRYVSSNKAHENFDYFNSSKRSNALMREKFNNESLNIQNSAYRNVENRDSYSSPEFNQATLDDQLSVNHLSQYSKSHLYCNDKIKAQNCFQCQFCGKVSTDQKHQKKSRWRPKIAEICNEIGPYKFQKVVKPSIEQLRKGFSCNVCSKRFQTRTDLKRDISIHNGKKPFSCGICGKKFSRKDALSQHASVHTGKKPFSSDQGNKNIHSLTHFVNKRFQCSMCGKSFVRKDDFLKHKLKHHSDN
ncbi:hypothetical protein CEXT_113591 [Caerostris extrusa]|uniref:C2H2-type domain-containing protein n=1 Tax=Caerostris extrusa TaxID=172846 RepID=A0AAV4YCM3_CAEEX|nr:hypothetical protein CEXT_113591 [Caerostris extrusa]